MLEQDLPRAVDDPVRLLSSASASFPEAVKIPADVDHWEADTYAPAHP